MACPSACVHRHTRVLRNAKTTRHSTASDQQNTHPKVQTQVLPTLHQVIPLTTKSYQPIPLNSPCHPNPHSGNPPGPFCASAWPDSCRGNCPSAPPHCRPETPPPSAAPGRRRSRLPQEPIPLLAESQTNKQANRRKFKPKPKTQTKTKTNKDTWRCRCPSTPKCATKSPETTAPCHRLHESLHRLQRVNRHLHVPGEAQLASARAARDLWRAACSAMRVPNAEVERRQKGYTHCPTTWSLTVIQEQLKSI